MPLSESDKAVWRTIAIVLAAPGVYFWPWYAFLTFPLSNVGAYNSGWLSSAPAALLAGVVMFSVPCATIWFARRRFSRREDVWLTAAVLFGFTASAAYISSVQRSDWGIDAGRVAALLAEGVGVGIVAALTLTANTGLE